jgi:hypothetical protein
MKNSSLKYKNNIDNYNNHRYFDQHISWVFTFLKVLNLLPLFCRGNKKGKLTQNKLPLKHYVNTKEIF